MALTQEQIQRLEKPIQATPRSDSLWRQRQREWEKMEKEEAYERMLSRKWQEQLQKELALKKSRTPEAMSKLFKNRALQQGGRGAVYGDVSKEDIVRNLRKPKDSGSVVPEQTEYAETIDPKEAADEVLLRKAKARWAEEDWQRSQEGGPTTEAVSGRRTALNPQGLKRRRMGISCD